MPEDIEKLVQLAAIYFEDGALHTAADRLQQAADALRELANARAAAIAAIS